MRQAHSERGFAGFDGEPRSGFFLGHEKKETREVFSVVLDAFGKNGGAIMFGRAASRDGGARFVSGGKCLAYAAGGVLGWNALPIWMRGKKALALGQRHRMGGYRTDIA